VSKGWICEIVFCGLVLASSSAASQVDISSVTIRMGVINMYRPVEQQAFGDRVWFLYPEVEIGGQFITPCLSWGLSWTYWTNTVDNTNPARSWGPYAYNTHTLAIRFTFRPRRLDPHWWLPLMVFAGAAEHFIREEYTGRVLIESGNAGVSNFRSTTPFIGVGFSVAIASRVSIEAEGLQFIPLKSKDLYLQKNRRAIALGCQVCFQ
jgi:hypothetical protein